MRRTTRHPLAVALVATALAASLSGVLAGCATGTDPGTSGTSSTQSAAPTPSASASSSSPEPSASGSGTDPAQPSGTPSAGSNVLTAPADGDTVQGPDVVLTGEGTAFEATLQWRVVSAATGETVQEGSTTAGANGEIGPFSVSVTLDPGVYTAQVWEPSMKDGSDDERRNLVSATFTVVG